MSYWHFARGLFSLGHPVQSVHVCQYCNFYNAMFNVFGSIVALSNETLFVHCTQFLYENKYSLESKALSAPFSAIAFLVSTFNINVGWGRNTLKKLMPCVQQTVLQLLHMEMLLLFLKMNAIKKHFLSLHFSLSLSGFLANSWVRLFLDCVMFTNLRKLAIMKIVRM